MLNEETILVKQVPDWHPEYDCIEYLVWELSQLTNVWGRPYTIRRIFCGSYNGTAVAAYTNALILNKKVLVPLFNISTDQQARAGNISGSHAGISGDGFHRALVLLRRAALPYDGNI